MKIVKIELELLALPECIIAQYKCLDPTCKTPHILGTLSHQLYHIPAARERWLKTMKAVLGDMVRFMTAKAGIDPRNVIVANAEDMN